MANEKDPRKSERDSGYENTNSDHVVVCAWLDSKMVLTVSNFIGRENVSDMTARARRESLYRAQQL